MDLAVEDTLETWTEISIGEICASVKSGGTPLSTIKEYYENGQIPWLKTKEIKNARIYGAENYITELGLRNSSASLIPANSISVAMYGDGGTAGRVGLTKVPLTTNQACCNLTVDERKADYEFIFYNLLGSYDELVGMKTGSGQQNLSSTLIKNFRLNLPPLAEQRAIASILSGLDAKIDLLRRQNNTLEPLAETLFRHWFIEGADEAWEMVTIGSILQTVLGGTPATGKPEYWDGNIPWINSGEVNNFRILAGSRFITELGMKKSNTKLLPKGTTVVAITGATLGQISLLEIETCANQSVVGIIPNEILPKEFVFLWIKHKIKEIILSETGGAQPHINKNDINETQIIIPDKNYLAEKMMVIKPAFEKITSNVFQIKTLISLRDTLLPKLMSGEVRVAY